jgi:hypothetical protein
MSLVLNVEYDKFEARAELEIERRGTGASSGAKLDWQ